MNRYVMVGAAVILLVFPGCEKETSDQRLVEIAVKQDEHEAKIGTMARKIEGVDKRLDEIQQSLQRISPAVGAAEPTKGGEPQVVEFKDTPEYKRITAQLSTVQQQLNAVQGELAKTQEAVASERERAQRRNPAAAWGAMSNPQELCNRLDALVRNFSPKIQDAARRLEFEGDVERFKRSVSENPSSQELHQRITNDLATRLANTQDERAREMIQREIKSLESASGEELEGRLDRYTRFQTFRQLRELVEKYNIPRETVSESGLISIGGGGEQGRRGPGRRGGPR